MMDIKEVWGLDYNRNGFDITAEAEYLRPLLSHAQQLFKFLQDDFEVLRDLQSDLSGLDWIRDCQNKVQYDGD